MSQRVVRTIEAALELLQINRERIELTMNYLNERTEVTLETFDLMMDELREMREATLDEMVTPVRVLKRTISVHDMAAEMKKKKKTF